MSKWIRITIDSRSSMNITWILKLSLTQILIIFISDSCDRYSFHLTKTHFYLDFFFTIASHFKFDVIFCQKICVWLFYSRMQKSYLNRNMLSEFSIESWHVFQHVRARSTCTGTFWIYTETFWMDTRTEKGIKRHRRPFCWRKMIYVELSLDQDNHQKYSLDSVHF